MLPCCSERATQVRFVYSDTAQLWQPENEPPVAADRSLMAAYELFQNGYEDVRVVRGGIGEWRRQQRTLVEED